VEQMQGEFGRVKIEFANVLFNLTGQPFRGAEKSWLAWWRREGKDFDVISVAELEEAREKEELRRLKQVTNSKFFGVRIVSHRVVFVIDVSGSMEEKMVTAYEGETSLMRMDVARRELINAIKSMERGALFNIIIFSSGVDPWLEDGIAGANQVERDEAEAFVARLKPGGGTNLYDAIKLAFGDAEVDTIFILSDGEPSVSVTDVNRIRKDVQAWNEHRNIQINTIGIGSKLKVLEWLAEDSGGKHIKLR
jgi:Mg-chelatase subunit ChlD